MHARDAALDAWLDRDPDPNTRAELEALRRAQAHAALEARFAGRLRFGTAGLRALMGAGPTRINRLVVQESTLGLGRYVQSLQPQGQSIAAVVGFDGRHQSRLFAEDAAKVLCALGFVVHLFDQPVPTPVAGFAVRRLAAAIGVVITASHNPPGYNGLKVYWHNGAQIVGPHDAHIARAIDLASTQPLVPLEPLAALQRAGVLKAVGQAMEAAYIDAIVGLVHRPIAGATPPPLHVAYSPLHGVGGRFAEAAVARLHNVRLYPVATQSAPNGDFPTVPYPNPEEDGAMDLVLALAAERDADIALANDPDADRLAMAVRSAAGDFRVLSGDELGALLADDRLANAPPDSVVATTIVSSRLLSRLADARGVAYFETLTGFKWIANGAIARQAKGQRFIFGYEEALGYILGDLVWDKDGIAALIAVCQIVQRLKAAGTNVFKRLDALYRQFGLHLTHQHTVAIDERHPDKPLSALLRAEPLQQIGGRRIVHTDDLQQSPSAQLVARRLAATEPSPLPKSDVLIYSLEGNARVIVRPSGTEPKLKCYYELFAEVTDDTDMHTAHATCRAQLLQLCAKHQQQLHALAAATASATAPSDAKTP